MRSDQRYEKDACCSLFSAQSGFLQQSAAPIGSETHGAEDVAIFARGPMAHLIHKTHEQSYIAYMMRYEFHFEFSFQVIGYRKKETSFGHTSKYNQPNFTIAPCQG